MPKYALVTAAYNEEKYIRHTLEAVTRQALRPEKWVIVSDGSTDKTDDIILEYAEKNSFISLHRLSKEHKRNFGAQVYAINAGYGLLSEVDFDFVGNLDADVSFAPDYFRALLAKFEADANLGLAGGSIYEESDGQFCYRTSNNPDSVPHAVQMFPRNIFERIGGYIPLPYGGPDWVAEVKVRQLGMKVHSFDDLVVNHHRPTLGAEGLMRGWYRQGLLDYSVGADPLFEFAKCVRRLRERPLIFGAALQWTAFLMCYARRQSHAMPREFIAYLRREQRHRLFGLSEKFKKAVS
jgi:biofilm PGA synthesis N-glycosyltransferase PgaC